MPLDNNQQRKLERLLYIGKISSRHLKFRLEAQTLRRDRLQRYLKRLVSANRPNLAEPSLTI